MWTRRTVLRQLAIAGAVGSFGESMALWAQDDDDQEATADDLWPQVGPKLNAGEYREAEQLLSKIVKLDAKFAPAYYQRGRVRFRLGQFESSVKDFDRYVELRPQLASRQWRRGIACFYAGQFRAGADQFKLYQTYHDNDVENSVWRFLCMAPFEGVKRARAEMLPIRNDRRVPMMAIYELFRGNASPWDVEAAIVSGEPEARMLAFRRFYAQLYLGLYFESTGNEQLGKRFVLQAADDHRETANINNYMWAVADVHAKRLRANEKSIQRKES